MKERIAFVSWGYLRVICEEHKTGLELKLVGKRTVYSCPDSTCNLALPTELYEKLLDDVVGMQNSDSFIIGHRWQRKARNEMFEFCVVSVSQGNPPTISVRLKAKGREE